jgi:ADP-sugar diphosphatase
MVLFHCKGGCDEFMKLYLYQKRLSRSHMEWLKDRATGLDSEGERIKLKLVPLDTFWKEAARDGKALSALALYENLKRQGKIPNMPDEPAEGPGMSSHSEGTKG